MLCKSSLWASSIAAANARCLVASLVRHRGRRVTRPAPHAQAEGAAEQRHAAAARLDELLSDDAAVLLPSAPGAAPRLRTPPGVLDAFRRRLLSLTAPAGLARLPQVQGLGIWFWILSTCRHRVLGAMAQPARRVGRLRRRLLSLAAPAGLARLAQVRVQDSEFGVGCARSRVEFVKLLKRQNCLACCTLSGGACRCRPRPRAGCGCLGYMTPGIALFT